MVAATIFTLAELFLLSLGLTHDSKTGKGAVPGTWCLSSSWPRGALQVVTAA